MLTVALNNRLEIFTDRDRQMKACSTMTIFELRGMPLVFGLPSLTIPF